MFCKYCGKPIDEGTMRCRICGRPVGQLEGGVGFWDLKEKLPEEEPAPEQAPEKEPEKKEETASAPDQIPTVAAANPADAKAVRDLSRQVKKLQEEVKNQSRQKRSALAGGAVVLALLGLALGVFVLYQLQRLSGKVGQLESALESQAALLQQVESAQEPQESQQPEIGSGAESSWQGFDQLAGVHLYYKQEIFDGPNKGNNDLRGQSINLGFPENGYEETPIFTARFLGPAGTYRYCWVKVETNEETKETYFTPLKEEEGYLFRNPNASDADKVFILSITGEVKEEHLGRYAFVAEDTQTHSAYVSAIVELYNRAEKDAGYTG